VKVRARKSIALPGLVGDGSKWRKRSVPLFGKDDCMDAGGRATHGAVAGGLGEILLDKSPSIPLLQRGR